MLLHPIVRKVAFRITPALLSAAALFAQSTPVVKFHDTFSPNPSLLWNNFAGVWTATNGQYAAQLPNNNPLTYSGLPFDLESFELTVTVTALADCGIWLRSTETNPGNDAFILLVLGGNGYGTGSRGGNAGNSVYFATSPTAIVNEVTNVFVPGNTYTITVTAKAGTYNVYVDGAATPVTSLVDTSLTHGEVGLYDNQPNTITGNGFGPPNTFSNFSLRGVPVPPAIGSFSPASGRVGAQVIIRGRNLQEASGVSFNGKSAEFGQYYPSGEIVAIVPAGATSGPITVTTPIGAAKSATSFTVTP